MAEEPTRLDQLKKAEAGTADSGQNSVMPGWFAEISEMWPGQVSEKKVQKRIRVETSIPYDVCIILSSPEAMQSLCLSVSLFPPLCVCVCMCFAGKY